ncbi:hypothetical protein DYB35_012932 [Aphanomyces astaci]|uniref:Uncharacterized protein n=1 Tax=Aphanomyces astaci TaxID=112090 RepID=A0A418CP72_APHAT|nr:hypothetical protein DYB35_012932 [Aphanomyces astaci]
MRSLRGYIDTVSKSFAPLDAALTEWYEAHGISRVFKLFASLPQLRDLVIAHAVFSANLPLLKMLPVELLCAVPYQLLDLAALNGRVAVLDFLRATLGHEEGTPWEAALPAGECGGYLDIVCCLHDRRSKDGSKRAVVLAAEYGHVEVVQFIHTHNPDTDTFQEALTTAATHNQLDVVACIIDLLGTSRRGFTAPMDAAASHGHLEMVKLLNQHDFPCTTNAIDVAAEYGRLEVVQWLYTHRTEGCTMWAMDQAAGNGHLEVVKWLDAQGALISGWGLTRAARNSQWEMVEFLVSSGLGNAILVLGYAKNHPQTVEFLKSHLRA